MAASAARRDSRKRLAFGRSIVVQLLAAISVVILIRVAVRRRILGPLRRLTAAVGAAGRNGGSSPVHVEGPAEIERLAEEINLVSERTRVEGLKNTHLAAASHELRGPLNSVVGLAETIIHHDARLEPGVRRELLQRIAKAGTRMDRILNDLFDVLRIADNGEQQLNRQPIDLERLARMSLRTVEGLNGQVVDIDAQGEGHDLDPMMVQRILENLLANAAKYAGPKAHIWVHVDECPEGVTILVEDDGPGVAAEERERIFERFERGRSVDTSGLGLGLSVVSRFADLHGGRAWVEDREGGGASFRVFLPASAPSAA